MKTKNLILIVALLSIATLTFSQSTPDRVNNHFTVIISLQSAMQNPYLVKAMHEQLNQDFLNGNQDESLYSATIKYKGNRYVIVGTYEEWKKFFEAALDDPTPES
jgi:hypothetical protein